MDEDIVIVDDERDILDLLRSILEFAGMRAVTVDHPAKLASTLDGVKPSLFLIDIMLKNSSGIEVAHWLRDNGFAGTPMVAMSASPVMARFASDSGVFQEAIDKPFDIDELLDCIHRSLQP